MKNGDQSMYGTISSSGKSREHARAEERRRGDAGVRPVDGEPALEGLGVGDELALRAAARRLSRSLLLDGPVLAVELGPLLGAVEPVDDADAPRGVLHVDDRPVIAPGRS